MISPPPVPPPKRWKFSAWPLTDAQQTAFDLLKTELRIHPTICTLLAQRGITNYETAHSYFRPSLSQLHDPFLMRDMDKAVRRLMMAIVRREKVLIYGDYDVDGTTSVAMTYSFLKKYVAAIGFYVPDRYKEGYGISEQGIEWAADQGFSLIIALDCGIKSVDKVATATELGIDFIICDHHRPGDQLPDAAAVLDPKRTDCAYPYKELSGCGVGFKLLQGFCLFNGIPLDELYPYLDLVLVSIASDIVPITGENRVLAFFGLHHLNDKPRPGLKALMSIAGCTSPMTISNVVFRLGPRINAAGRIDHAKDAVSLLLAGTDAEADERAATVQTYNQQRSLRDSQTTDQALGMIAENDVWRSAKSTVLFDPTWSKGVVGIVASRCIEHYYRPTIILTESNGKAAGSARSVVGFDVYEALEKCADLLEQFGGHMYAAGMTLPIENIDAFRQRFEAVVGEHIRQEDLIPLVDIDLPLELTAVNDSLLRILKQMEPFGPENMQPVFVSHNVYLADKPYVMKEKHLKLQLRQEEQQPPLTAVGFGFGYMAHQLQPGQPFSICYQITENDYNGQKTLQLQLKDIQVPNPQAA